MAKWKCEICGNEFDNFHAQGFDNKIYCPLCFFKKENQELKKQIEELNRKLFLTKNELDMREKSIDNKLNQQNEFIKYLEDEIKLEIQRESIGCETTNKRCILEEILQKYKEIIGAEK